MISIVIPLYNKEKQIARTLQCVLNQTFQDFEVIIINDGSTDNSVIEIQQVRDKRIKLIHQSNAGVSAARNRGIEEARFELIAFLDADDEWKPTYLETQYWLYQKYPACSVYACNYEFQNMDGVATPTTIRKLSFRTEDGVLSNYFEVASCSHPPLWTSAVMVKKKAIQAIGGFPIGIKSGEDLLTWARLAVEYKIAYSREILSIFIYDTKLFNADQQSRKPEEIDFVGSELATLYQKYPNCNGLKTYNALWHKMRARIYIEKGEKKLALKECLKSMHYAISIKILVFFSLSFLPFRLSNYLFKKLR